MGTSPGTHPLSRDLCAFLASQVGTHRASTGLGSEVTSTWKPPRLTGQFLLWTLIAPGQTLIHGFSVLGAGDPGKENKWPQYYWRKQTDIKKMHKVCLRFACRRSTLVRE